MNKESRAWLFAKFVKSPKAWISLIVIVVITMLVAIVVLNSVLMNVLERTREYGLMRAMGTSPALVFSWPKSRGHWKSSRGG